MKLITAVIKPHQVEEVKEALALLGVQGMTVTEAQGFGRQGGHTETYRGTEYKVAFTPKSRLEIVVSDDDADKAVDAVLGSVGDALGGGDSVSLVGFGTFSVRHRAARMG